jgi:mannose-6-phosphate isomerase-like protein (cupin superfamily)
MFETRRLSTAPDDIAPDGSEIRLVSVVMAGGSMVHCTLKPGQITQAVQHRTVAEAWLCISGNGRLWRSRDEDQEMIDLTPGTGASIAAGTRFQFRNDGDTSLEIVIATFPPWPGEGEAIQREGAWTPSV